MEITLADKNLTELEKNEIEKLLKKEDKNISNDLEQMWYLMDLVWDDYECENSGRLNWDNIGRFYSHPVWLLNGLFIEQDNVSMEHRHSISDWVVRNKFKHVVDYGGGFGTLARLVAQKDKTIHMDIYEPHPSEFGLKRANEYTNIDIVGKLGTDYDCLMSTDVLEHVNDPLKDFEKMIKSVKLNGYLIIANAFYPMIKCHLPQNFHFRYSFNYFANMMGLESVGVLEGSHATIFKKTDDVKLNWRKIRFYEKLSKLMFSCIEFSKPILKPVKRLIIK